MKFKALTLGLLLSLFTAFFATNAFAGPSDDGLDVRVSATVPIVGFSRTVESERGWDSYEDNYSSKDFMTGFNARISLGYRWSIIGVYIDQDLSYAKYMNRAKEDLDPFFLGGTYFTVRLLIPLNNIEFDVGLGLGLMYSTGDDLRDHTNHPAIITDSDGDASPCFAAKLALELTYFFNDHIGFGLDLDYSVGMMFDWWHENGRSYSQTDYVHFFTPGLHLRYAF